MVRHAGRHERLVEHERGFLEPRLDVAVRPLDDGLARRQLAFLRAREIARGPLRLLELRRAGQAVVDHVAVEPRVGTAREQAHERVDRERQLFEVDLDLVDRVLRGRLVDGRDREDRLADEHRLVGEDLIAGLRLRRHLVGREDPEHAGHRERFARIDVADAGMRHRAQQQPAERHALGAEIFRVLGLAGDFAVDVGRDEVLTQ